MPGRHNLSQHSFGQTLEMPQWWAEGLFCLLNYGHLNMEIWLSARQCPGWLLKHEKALLLLRFYLLELWKAMSCVFMELKPEFRLLPLIMSKVCLGKGPKEEELLFSTNRGFVGKQTSLMTATGSTSLLRLAMDSLTLLQGKVTHKACREVTRAWSPSKSIILWKGSTTPRPPQRMSLQTCSVCLFSVYKHLQSLRGAQSWPTCTTRNKKVALIL